MSFHILTLNHTSLIPQNASPPQCPRVKRSGLQPSTHREQSSRGHKLLYSSSIATGWHSLRSPTQWIETSEALPAFEAARRDSAKPHNGRFCPPKSMARDGLTMSPSSPPYVNTRRRTAITPPGTSPTSAASSSEDPG